MSLVVCGSVFSGVDGLSIDITTMVDIRDQTNKELAMRLITDIQSGDAFYTDLNGFQVSPTLNNIEEYLLFICILSQYNSMYFSLHRW